MSQSDLQGEQALGVARAGFAVRSPSQTWEQMPLAEDPQNFVWVWFKPPSVPQGLVLRVPDAVDSTNPHFAAQLTMRHLLSVAGVEPECVSTWSLQGIVYDGMNGTSLLLDQPIPAPVVGVDPSIVVDINPQLNPQREAMQAVPAPVTHSAANSAEGNLSELFESIAADWHASLDIEKDLVRLRMMLVDAQARLKTLNRDLTSQERQHASQQEKKDWLEARRWLRDAALGLSKCIKEHDIGDTSSAGQRNWFEQTYQKFIVSRQPFEGIQRARINYQNYRKMLLKLHVSMNTAHWNAIQNAARRAQQILTRIAARIRDAQTKKNFLGVMID